MLPWVQSARRAYRDRGDLTTAESYLACGPCRQVVPESARQLWNCGHAPRLPDHPGEYPLPDGGDRSSCDTCPGYLVSLPQVIETARAYPWWDKGQLRDYCDGEVPSPVMRDYIDVFRVAVNEAEIAEIHRAREGSRG